MNKIFSFFSGSGFLDLGFENNDYKIVLVNEFSEAFQDAYKYSRKKMHKETPQYGYFKDINDFLGNDASLLKGFVKDAKADGSLVGFIGGPPCPDFSVAGKQRGRNGDNGKLSLSYVQLIINQKPNFFLFENVKGLWRTKRHREYFEELKEMLHQAGYETTERLTNSLEFGAPQDRDRILMFGVQRSLLGSHDISDFDWTARATHTLAEAKNQNWATTNSFEKDSVTAKPIDIDETLTVQYWFDKNDVENHPNANDYFTPRAGLPKMKTIEEGDVSKKSYKRLQRWKYSPTVCYGNNEVHLHPYKERRLSVAEALALQSLPKEFELPADMSLSNKFKTVGNGVPYLLAYNIAAEIKEYLEML